MPISHLLHISRRDEGDRALITVSGEIDLETAPELRHALQGCLLDGIRVIDIDLAAVPFCDCSGLNAFLAARGSASASGAVLRLHSPTRTVLRLLTVVGVGRILLGVPAAEPTGVGLVRGRTSLLRKAAGKAASAAAGTVTGTAAAPGVVPVISPGRYALACVGSTS